MNETYTLHRGTRPLVISVPHAGTEIAPEVATALLPRALAVEDCDWHLDRLYDFAAELGASLIVPRYARYVVDLNRPPENTPMYPGQNNTELCPTRFFSGEPLYRDGRAPDEAEVQRRVASYWRPYHEALQGELVRLQAEHGHAVLFDGHSIAAELPWLFEGRLPDLNLGTAAGSACAPALRERLAAVLAAQSRFGHVVDGRFKGGYITRHYGRPHDGVHAVQMEMTWPCYLAEAMPPVWDAARAADARAVLRTLAETMLAWRP
ncbi:N-formylglutamate deformylase [Rubrivivax sp. JA1024]|nr:N-formylglutamate deformylase [Rubrivivax sp. JA1024]